MNKAENNVVYNLIKKSQGLTITEIVNKSRFTRSFVRTTLAKLEGAKKIWFRKIGMAKVYFVK